MRVLDGSNTWSLIRPGYESSPRSVQLVRRWGIHRESVPSPHIGDEKVLGGLSVMSGLASNPANREIASSSGASEHQDIFFPFFSIFF
jgi:hypothetical protein